MALGSEMVLSSGNCVLKIYQHNIDDYFLEGQVTSRHAQVLPVEVIRSRSKANLPIFRFQQTEKDVTF